MGKRIRRWLMKKLYNKKFFYEDPTLKTEFYLGTTSYYDMTILMVDVMANTFREFLVDFKTLREIYLFAQEGLINPIPANNKVEKPIHIVKSYLTKDGFSVIAASDSKMYGSTIIGKVMEINRSDEDLEKVLSVKRIAYLPMKKDHVMGIDTIALPLSAAENLIDLVKKMFKDVDIELDFQREGEDEDALN